MNQQEVMKSLQICASGYCDGCMYYGYDDIRSCVSAMAEDAFACMKELELDAHAAQKQKDEMLLKVNQLEKALYAATCDANTQEGNLCT